MPTACYGSAYITGRRRLMVRIAASIALMFVAFLSINSNRAFAQEADQIRLRCVGSYKASHITTGPNSAQISSTFVIDFAQKTVTDASDATLENGVSLDAESVAFQNPSGAAERISRGDGSWAIAGLDGDVTGIRKEVVNTDAF